MLLRRNIADRVSTNLKLYFDQIHDENKKQFILSKLSETIQQIFDLLYGTIDDKIQPQSNTIHQLISKLLEPNNDLFYKLLTYRRYFAFETQTYIAKILKYVIQNGSKHGVQSYIKRHTASNSHNKIIDALFEEFDKYPGATFSVLQAMTNRPDLTSMFLYKIKIKSPKFIVKHNRKQKARHHKSQSLQNGTKLKKKKAMKPSANGNKATNGKKHVQYANNAKQSKHGRNNTEPSLSFAADKNRNTTQKHYKQTVTKHEDVSFVEGLFILIQWRSLHISLDAFKTLKYLFTTKSTKIKSEHNRLSQYLYQNSEFILTQFNTIINSENTLNKRQCFMLLNELLIEPDNFDVLMQYVTQKKNLSTSKRILTDEFISAQTDEHRHNVIIDALLEDYFEDAGDILIEIASRANLSDLLLNHISITDADYKEMNDGEDTKHDAQDVQRHKARNKNLQLFLGTNNIPYLSNESSVRLEIFDATSSTDSKHKTRYDGNDLAMFADIAMNKLSERPFVYELIALIEGSCSTKVATYAFHTLQRLLTVNKDICAKYLSQHYEKIMETFQRFMVRENKMRKMFLRLLCDLLLERKNKEFRNKFKAHVNNLKMIMNLLNDDSDSIKYDAFQIFAIFVASKQKSRKIHIVLWRNTKQHNLCPFIQNLLPNQSQKYKELERDKKMIIRILKKLPTPKSDESFLKLPRNEY